MLKSVFVVEHLHVFDVDDESVKMIGVYDSRAAAEAAVEQYKLLPGFRDVPEGFNIDEYELNKGEWAEGYVTLTDEESAALWAVKDDAEDLPRGANPQSGAGI